MCIRYYIIIKTIFLKREPNNDDFIVCAHTYYTLYIIILYTVGTYSIVFLLTRKLFLNLYFNNNNNIQVITI